MEGRIDGSIRYAFLNVVIQIRIKIIFFKTCPTSLGNERLFPPSDDEFCTSIVLLIV